MIEEITTFFRDLNLAKLRVVRPSKIVFFCGGVVSQSKPAAPQSLRDFIYWRSGTINQINGSVVLAEKAKQLYRETTYRDLISFEEDVAHLSSLILVIAESPGSLAELGAFASNEYIQRKLRLILQQTFAEAESFIRFGPVERIKRANDEFVGFFPWRVTKSGKLVLRSVKPHRTEIIKFINQLLDATPKTELIENLGDGKNFFIVLWIIYISFAIPLRTLNEVTTSIGLEINERRLRDLIYCLELFDWVKVEFYSGKHYFYVPFDRDPFDYGFRENVIADSSERKAEIANVIRSANNIPKHVRKKVAASRARS